MSKYVLNTGGWEVYLYDTGINRYLTVRHHHATGSSNRTATYSNCWPFSEWHLFSYSRIGANAYHYKDGEAVTTVGSGSSGREHGQRL